MAVRISVPKPAKYFSLENFLGAGTTYLGIYGVENWVMPKIAPMIPLTGDLAKAAGMAVKAAIGGGVYYLSGKTGGTLSDILAGSAFGCMVSVVKDLVELAVSKISAPAAFAPRAPPATSSPPPVTATQTGGQQVAPVAITSY
jgi:hypothetical protein